MSVHLTYEEKLLLSALRREAQEDRDCIPHRTLVGAGLARRIDVGLIEVTAAGLEAKL